jgi:aminotransferase in exopolysaccharide biosynthesis
MSSFSESINFIRNNFENREVIPLHEPKFNGNEKEYLLDCIDSTYVSSVGAYVDRFELMMAIKSQTSKAIAVVNGTAGIQVALKLCGVSNGDEVITQALTFIATANAISYLGASPIFLDVDLDTMGLSPIAVSGFLENHGELRNGVCFNKKTNNIIAACLPMHTFGFPVHIEKLIEICDRWNIPIVEDAAESLGSEYNGKSTGSFGKFGVFSFNGNKIVTCGGGGAIVTNDRKLGINAKHITTTAKVSHPFEYIHDDIGYNFRMPNLNAALACAQLEQLDSFLDNKRMLALEYKSFFDSMGIYFRTELPNTKANYWLMCLELENRRDRDSFLKETNDNKIMTRPIWQLLFKLPMYEGCQRDSQRNANYLEDRIVNIPSSVRR